MKRIKLIAFSIALIALASCKKEKGTEIAYQYYEIGFKRVDTDWRDTAFVVRTASKPLIEQLDAQLLLPVEQRKIVSGALVRGNGGYNKNGDHEFGWHFKEDDWSLTDVTVEIYDGRPYSDIDKDLDYWIDTVKRYGSWGSYVRKRLDDK